MGMKLQTPLSDIDYLIDEMTENVQNALVSVLTDVGLQCVREARDSGSYMDQTGNLRSSIGFVVTREGRIEEKCLSDGVGDGKAVTKEGVAKSDALLSRLAASYQQDVSLIVAAGMDYAVYVEGMGKNVLTSASLLADRLIPQMLTNLGIASRKR